MRLGSVSPTSSNLNQAWVAVNVDYEQINTPLDKVIILLIFAMLLCSNMCFVLFLTYFPYFAFSDCFINKNFNF